MTDNSPGNPFNDQPPWPPRRSEEKRSGSNSSAASGSEFISDLTDDSGIFSESGSFSGGWSDVLGAGDSDSSGSNNNNNNNNG